LPGRRERKAFTTLGGRDAAAIADVLTHSGFRRAQSIAYRPACDACEACVSSRVVVDRFEPGRRWSRVLARNADLSARLAPAGATEEQYWLFHRYLHARHGPKGMAEMGIADFVTLVEDSPVRTHVVEYRYTSGVKDGELAAFAIIDLMSDGLSLVYSVYDPDAPKRSLGSFVVLDHIRQAARLGLPHVYLGYWIKGSEKMGYKAEFQPLELLRGGVWTRFEDTDAGERAPSV
jgi:arginine-tRNA-protein transferase